MIDHPTISSNIAYVSRSEAVGQEVLGHHVFHNIHRERSEKWYNIVYLVFSCIARKALCNFYKRFFELHSRNSDITNIVNIITGALKMGFLST